MRRRGFLGLFGAAAAAATVGVPVPAAVAPARRLALALPRLPRAPSTAPDGALIFNESTGLVECFHGGAGWVPL